MIIGIMGKAGHGKDTLARCIRHEFHGMDRECWIMPMASKLKEVTSLVFDIPVRDLEDRAAKESVHPNTYGMTVRKVMQLIGTDMFREFINHNVWIDSQKREIANVLKGSPDAHILIPDVRFQNEVDMVKELGGVIVKITRPEAVEISSSNHVSEALVDTIEADFYINNDMDKLHLQEEAWNLLNELKLCD